MLFGKSHNFATFKTKTCKLLDILFCSASFLDNYKLLIINLAKQKQ